ncbi:autotransporter outer membrane beta-barrel domain-containing protein [Bradyrhizobium sp. SZCCHNS3002]|uniref:autotransporter outer membrane beta-barrel domain-containing protein n=1 Tax=Bradyrhizobium sp. SZCCHNS3002 TaxID=3057310 RepID=UPI0028F171E3|nr:autotransporter outer membrane beta-barrel domain-containing protein [Bradyrhizobium sp. SZCCHNS3002]
MFMGQLTDPFIAGRDDAATAVGGASSFAAGDARTAGRAGTARDAFAAIGRDPPVSFEQRWSVWAAGYGGAQTTDGNIGTGATTRRVNGGIGGADYRLSPDPLVGFALAGGGTSFNVANGGSGRSDLFQACVFARHQLGTAYLAGALAYGWQDVTTDRTVTIAGIDWLQARFNASTFAGRVEGGYRFAMPCRRLLPWT